jgi:hypothetical protein
MSRIVASRKGRTAAQVSCVSCQQNGRSVYDAHWFFREDRRGGMNAYITSYHAGSTAGDRSDSTGDRPFNGQRAAPAEASTSGRW